MSDSFNLALEEIKERLPEYLRAVHGIRIKKQTHSQIALLCPHHDEKTPSFIADCSKGTWLYKCHGCGIGGSIIDLARLDLGTTNQREGIDHAARVTGIQLPSEGFKELTRDEKAAYRHRKQLADDETRAREAQQAEEAYIARGIAQERDNILRPYLIDDWRSEMETYKLCYGDTPEQDTHAFIASLFSPDDIIWTGDLGDSGQPHHEKHFTRVRDLRPTIEHGENLPARICPATFKQGSYSRGKENVAQVKYICIEADDFNPDPATNMKWNAALAFYLMAELGMTLRAVIMTGGKSLHCWYDVLIPSQMKELLIAAESLGIDHQTLTNPAAPLRLPNCQYKETEHRAKLLLLNPQITEEYYV